MEETLKPMALEKFAAITEIFHQFAKAQAARLDAMANGLGISAKDEDAYQQLREDLTAEVESVQFHQQKIEYLVDQLYSYNRRLTTLGGQMLRLAERHKVPRKDFLDHYVNHELDEGWLEKVGGIDKKWAAFAETRRARSSASATRSPKSRRQPAWRSANSAASSTWCRRASARPASPRRKWWKPTCASSSPSPRNTPTAACNSSTSFRKAISA
jgi:hypothetical protein